MRKRKCEDTSVSNKRHKNDSILNNLLLPSRILADDVSTEEIQCYFDTMASYLMNHTVLLIGETTYCRMVEIEFYFSSLIGTHSDPVSHRHPLMMRSGQWYFLQSFSRSNENNYRGGNYKGMDFTIGVQDYTGNSKYYGAVMIRALEELDDQGSRVSYVEGPSKCVDFILHKIGVSTQHELVTKHFPHNLDPATGSLYLHIEKPIDSEYYPLYIRQHNHSIIHIPMKSSRVGNTLKNTTHKEDRVRFLLKPYRYCLYPKQVKKAKNQLIVCMYHHLIKEPTANKEQVIDQIYETCGTQKNIITKYIKAYEQGLQHVKDGVLDLKKVESYFGKDLSGNDMCRLHGILSQFL